MNAAKAKVYLNYDGDLNSLAMLLEEALALPKFYLKSDQDYPHELVAMSECLGFEVWLYECNEKEGFTHLIEFETCITVEDIDKVKSHDISRWFAKHLSIVSELKVEL